MTVHPCTNLRCTDTDGNRRLTTHELCDGCHKHLRRTLDRLVVDYVVLRSTSPIPKAQTTRRASGRTSGHPAQWASDTARQIADLLDATSDALRDHLGHLPPPQRTRAESRVVEHAYATLTARWHDLADYPGAGDTYTELTELHSRIRGTLGLTRQRVLLPAPCPSCNTLGVIRTIGDDRSDTIECEACGRVIPAGEYGLYARILIDDLLDQADEDASLSAAT